MQSFGSIILSYALNLSSRMRDNVTYTPTATNINKNSAIKFFQTSKQFEVVELGILKLKRQSSTGSD